MKRLKLNKYIIIGGIVGVVSVGCLTSTVVKNMEMKSYTKTTVVNENKILEKDMVIEAMNEVSNLEIFQVSINKSIKLKQGKVFKKEQDVKFVASGKYSLNLANITSDNVIIDENEITIFCTDPTIEANFQENETIYSEVEKGFLTFSDMKYTVEETEQIKSELKTSILNEMNSDENMQLAKDKASKSIEGILSNIAKNNISVSIKWVK